MTHADRGGGQIIAGRVSKAFGYRLSLLFLKNVVAQWENILLMPVKASAAAPEYGPAAPPSISAGGASLCEQLERL